jgi:hypothetical protein
MFEMDAGREAGNETPEALRRRKGRGRWAAVGLLAVGVLAGGIVSSAMSASAATTATAPAAVTATAANPAAPQGGGGIGGAAPVRSDEKQITGANAATLRAAALKAVPGATVVRIESDAGDAAYEVHMTKPDGSVVTVKFDKNLTVLRVETGMGKGDPAPAGAPQG